jgi:hypothetical protein
MTYEDFPEYTYIQGLKRCIFTLSKLEKESYEFLSLEK